MLRTNLFVVSHLQLSTVVVFNMVRQKFGSAEMRDHAVKHKRYWVKCAGTSF